MSRITKIKLGEGLTALEMPFKNDDSRAFMIKQITGLSDVVFSHAEVSYDQIYTSGNGRDITLLLVIKKPIDNHHMGTPRLTPLEDYHAVRRLVAKAAPLDEEIVLTIYIDADVPYAQTVCTVKNVSASFSDEQPTIAIELTSIYTCLTLYDKVELSGLLFGIDAQIPHDTHDYTPVQVVITLATQLAAWYNIYVSSDWISINTSVLRSNYPDVDVDNMPTGSTIRIDTDESEEKLTTNYGVYLCRPAIDPATGVTYLDLNIETACDVGPNGFKFIPNEPMLVRTRKIPATFSGETVSLVVYPRLSGV